MQHRIEVIRSRVPVAHQEDFDSRLEEARAAMNLRDDNGPTTAEWPLGLLRLAMLEVGRRMVAAGVRCFLVGEALMRQADVAAATRALLGIRQLA